MADNVGGHQVEHEKRMVHTFRAIDAAWADFANLDRAHTLSMASAQEVDMHGEVGEKDLQRESHARLAISPLVDNQGEVVDLENHAEVSDGA